LADFNAPKLSAKQSRAWLKDSRPKASDTPRDPWA
jgi:hypothetical protein